MAKYYMLECYGKGPGRRAQVEVITDIDGGWKRGRRFPAPPAEPVEFEVFVPGDMVSMFKGAAGLLMRDSLVEALLAVGVDNLDIYDAIVRTESGDRTWTNYKAVNIIGVVACADMAKFGTSAPEGELIDVFFDGLVIDERKIGEGKLMFRLAEAIAGIVIHEKVKNYLEEHGFDDLSFEAPEDWIG